MAFDILETHELAGVIRTFPPMSSYWLDLCFPNVHFSNTEYIDFDIVDKARRLAPFVAPNVQGQPTLTFSATVGATATNDPLSVNNSAGRTLQVTGAPVTIPGVSGAGG